MFQYTMFQYTPLHQDRECLARFGTFSTPHGLVELPTFMPVGTRGSVKGLERQQLEDTGSKIVLGNTYHLTLRPGEKTVRKLGGLHGFTGWQDPMLTDSGGFQLFSLAQLTKITEQGAVFRSHIDGQKMELSPERSVEIQADLGSDIAMVLDHVVGLPNKRDVVADAMERTTRWAKRSQQRHSELSADLSLEGETFSELREQFAETESIDQVPLDQLQAQFAIVQGGLEPDLRIASAQALSELNFPGYAVGGLSVGETPEEMYQMLDVVVPHLPSDKPRYLMGVGRPEDLLEGIRRGIDMFDCVMPSRNGRNAMAFTRFGRMRLRNAQYEQDRRPLEEDCPCPACQRSRGYIRHLFMTGEMLGPILLTIHNITYYQRLMQGARDAIRKDAFLEYYRRCFDDWQTLDQA